jgi:hypothetical protein
MQDEAYEVRLDAAGGPNGFYRTDKEAGPVIMDWHRYTMFGCRLFGLTHDGAVVSFLTAGFRRKQPAIHIYLTGDWRSKHHN